MSNFMTGGMRRSPSLTSHGLRGIRRGSGVEVKIPPAFEMKIKPESWKREEEANIKPMVWVSELRRKFFEITALSIAAGQHILIDVVVDNDADLGRDDVDSNESEKGAMQGFALGLEGSERQSDRRPQKTFFHLFISFRFGSSTPQLYEH